MRHIVPNLVHCHAFRCRQINEVVLRTSQFEDMLSFYIDIVGLSLLRRFDNVVAFMHVGDKPGEFMSTVTLFCSEKLSNFMDRPFSGLAPQATTLHHFALNIDKSEVEAARTFLIERGIQFSKAVHTWIGWDSTFFQDPDGNTVELVCYDPDLDRRDSYDFSQLYGDPLGER